MRQAPPRADGFTVVAGALVLAFVGALLVALVGLVPAQPASGSRARLVGVSVPAAASASATPAAAPTPEVPSTLPDGGRTVLDGHRLVAYYGSPGSGALGVLGQAPPDRMVGRLRRAAAAFARPGHPVQPVFELIVTVADRHPGPDGDYSHDVSRAQVRRYVEAAHRHGVLLVLDLQTGRADFPSVAKRWAWALRDPWVGLALDPEWRMRPGQVPGQVIGSVRASEVNATSAWLDDLTAAADLPQKLFVFHQFGTRMVDDLARVVRRPHLATVQHVDGYGSPGEKLATFHRVARPDLFTLGFKLFYRQDRPLMSAAAVLGVRPRVGFVSFQ